MKKEILLLIININAERTYHFKNAVGRSMVRVQQVSQGPQAEQQTGGK